MKEVMFEYNGKEYIACVFFTDTWKSYGHDLDGRSCGGVLVIDDIDVLYIKDDDDNMVDHTHDLVKAITEELTCV